MTLKFRKLTETEIAVANGPPIISKLTVAQLRKEHYQRKAAEDSPKPKRARKHAAQGTQTV